MNLVGYEDSSIITWTQKAKLQWQKDLNNTMHEQKPQWSCNYKTITIPHTKKMHRKSVEAGISASTDNTN